MSADFRGEFGYSPAGTWAAPGRINLIGEHTDYNDGFVLPIALPHQVTVTAARRDDDVLRLVSRQAGGRVELRIDDLTPGRVTGWAAYPAGVVWALRQRGHPLHGLDLLIDGDVPPGAGLSSSAALECATALAAAELYDVDLAGRDLAELARYAENEFVGMPCGVMDQAASVLCTAGHALLLDTRSMAATQVPFDPAAEDLTLLVIDTRAPHRLVDGAYAARRRSCERAAVVLGVPALRDIGSDDLDRVLAALPEPELRTRTRHVVTENDRVERFVALLRAGRIAEAGPVLTASHVSLRDDYEVTSPELDTAVEAALAAGAVGARMTGGGFGGCVIALIARQRVEQCVTEVRQAFERSGFAAPATFTAAPSDGAHRVA
ncbi:galactokinase [Haloechinothrix halophila]|uniref:galactokinase n=1 Tax=Haloechinothrix halophila TaxID=1069073 RepID=UPI000407D190|nr:galactokinase [Haloechinothrix halophila]